MAVDTVARGLRLELQISTEFARITGDSRLLALLLEPLEGPLKIFVIGGDDFRHAIDHLSAAGDDVSGVGAKLRESLASGQARRNWTVSNRLTRGPRHPPAAH